MNIQAFTENEKTLILYRKLREVIDNKNLRDRQGRVYELLNTYNVNISDTNMEKLLHNEGLKIK